MEEEREKKKKKTEMKDKFTLVQKVFELHEQVFAIVLILHELSEDFLIFYYMHQIM